MSDPFISWLQSRLTSHGFAVGPIDGRMGNDTTRALKAFQRSRRVTANGLADAKTVELLRATSSAVPAAVKAQIPNRDKPAPAPTKPQPITAQQWPRQADVQKVFGEVGTRQMQIDVPFDMVLAWDTDTRLRQITVHELVAASAQRALRSIAETYSTLERRALGLHLFGGSLNVRRMRGGKSFSMHSWGIAIDFDPARNALATHAPMARLSDPDALPFWRAWEAEGWTSLGRARDFDWMHVQAARL